MCGIAGIRSNEAGTADKVRAMMDSIAHRGPDAAGFYASHEGLALGHRRLSIIGIEDGQQPIASEDGSVRIVCNGEIYNYRSLRAELERAGHRFATHSDSEVIVHLWEEHGADCLQYLRGMFAFAIWDERDQSLFLARDHLGQKPLFYFSGDGSFAFASEIKALLSAYPALREMDEQALDQYLALRIIASPATMFRRIRKLPPAHWLRLDRNGEVTVRRYWDLSFEPKRAGDEAELLDELEALLIETLELHCVADVPVGAFLSGGIDSGLLVTMLGRHVSGEGLATFSMGIPYGDYNEAPAARRVARSIGAEHHEYEHRPSMLDTLPDVVWHMDEPSDPLSVCAFLLARDTAQEIKVVIGGDGGDELFGGYDRYYGNLYAGRYARIPGILRRGLLGPVIGALPDGRWYKSRAHQLKWLHAGSFQSGAARYARSMSYFYFDDAARAALHGPRFGGDGNDVSPYACIEVPYDRLDARSPVDRMLYADMQCRLPDHPVLITDRTSMAFGLETRSPYLDVRLAEFAARLPAAMKIRGRNLRYLQKALARRYMPPEVLSRPKQGFSVALPYLLKDEYELLYGRFLSSSRLIDEGWLDGAAVRRLVAEHSGGQRDHGNRLWLLLNAEIWYRLHVDQISRPDLFALMRG